MKPRCHRVCVASTKSDSSLRAFWKGVCVRDLKAGLCSLRIWTNGYFEEGVGARLRSYE